MDYENLPPGVTAPGYPVTNYAQGAKHLQDLNRQALIGGAVVGGVDAMQVWKATGNRNATSQAFFNGMAMTYFLCLVIAPSVLLLLVTPFILAGMSPGIGVITGILGILGLWLAVHINRTYLHRRRLLMQGILLRGPRQPAPRPLPVQGSVTYYQGRSYIYDIPTGWREIGQK